MSAYMTSNRYICRHICLYGQISVVFRTFKLVFLLFRTISEGTIVYGQPDGTIVYEQREVSTEVGFWTNFEISKILKILKILKNLKFRNF